MAWESGPGERPTPMPLPHAPPALHGQCTFSRPLTPLPLSHLLSLTPCLKCPLSQLPPFYSSPPPVLPFLSWGPHCIPILLCPSSLPASEPLPSPSELSLPPAAAALVGTPERGVLLCGVLLSPCASQTSPLGSSVCPRNSAGPHLHHCSVNPLSSLLLPPCISLPL